MTNRAQCRSDRVWAGVDLETRAFCERLEREKKIVPQYKSAARDWFTSCRDAGLPTHLDADLHEPRMAQHLDKQLESYCYPGLKKRRRIHMRYLLNGLKVYVLALQEGLRTRPVPQVIVPVPRTWATTSAEARAKLPADDQQALEKIGKLLKRQAKRQWQGLGSPSVKGPDGRMHKSTLSVGSAELECRVVGYFLRYAHQQQWTPFTLDGLLTPERVTKYLYYSERCDGGGFSDKTIESRETALIDFFYRGRMAHPAADAVVVITQEREEAIRKAMAEEQLHKDAWNRRPPELGNTGPHKWYPGVEQVRLAIESLEDDLVRLDERLARGRITRRRYWLDLRNTVLTLCTLFCMWRVDTAATGSLIHLRRDPVTQTVTDENGFVIIDKIARAKDVKGDWYPFVPELLLPPNVVRYIEKLLAFEDRSLAQPLRPGEAQVVIHTGDHWGKDRVPSGEFRVVPIFRKRPDRPEGITYFNIQDILEDQLRKLRFAATGPHELRAAGAIYWRFIQEMPEDLVMLLGLWEDEGTLRENYAHIDRRDARAKIATYVPTKAIAQQSRHGAREQAAADALAVLGKMLEKPTNPRQARRLLADLRRHCERIDQTIAADLGTVWEPIRPDRFQPGEIEKIDDALRPLGYPRGVASVIGRDVFARDVLETRAAIAAPGQQEPLALRRARAEAQNYSEAVRRRSEEDAA